MHEASQLGDSVLKDVENSKTNPLPRLITEYGCIEQRNKHTDEWNRYGEKVPSYSHFGCWAALALGHAGVPFKWNDGKEHGEMKWKTEVKEFQNKGVWDKQNYQVDNYKELNNVTTFLNTKGEFCAKVDLAKMYPIKLQVVTDKSPRTDFNAWGLADNGKDGKEAIIAWIYDRKFKRRTVIGSLHITGLVPGKEYKYAWFNTWKGKYIREYGKVHSEKSGVISIPLPTFPEKGMTLLWGGDCEINKKNDFQIVQLFSSIL